MSDDSWSAPASDATPAPVSLAMPGRLLVGQQVLLIAFRVASATAFAADLAAPEVLSDGPLDLVDPLGMVLATGMFLAAAGLLAISLGGLPIWVWWHWRAARNLELQGRGGKYSAKAHAGWWFVPFANLVVPYHAMTELVRLSGPEPQSWDLDPGFDPTPLTAWWGCWIAGNLLAGFAWRVDTGGLAVVLDVLVTVLVVAAAVQYIGLVRRVERLQSAGVTQGGASDHPAPPMPR